MPQEYLRDVSVKSFSEIPSEYALYWDWTKGTGLVVTGFSGGFAVIERVLIRGVLFQGFRVDPTITTPQSAEYAIRGNKVNFAKAKVKIDLDSIWGVGIAEIRAIIGVKPPPLSVTAGLKFNSTTNKVYYLNKNNTWVELDKAGFVTYEEWYRELILNLDLVKKKYLKIEVGQKEYDLSNIDLYQASNTGFEELSMVKVKFTEISAGSGWTWAISQIYIDRLD
jgi:hypothetical protein